MMRRVLRGLALVAAIALLPTLSNCGGGGDNGGITNPPAAVVSRIDLSASTTTLSAPQTLQLSAVARTATGTMVSSPTLAWTSSASNVATVNSSGVVTAVAPGTAIITVASGTVTATLTVTVVAAGGTVASVAVTLSDATLQLGNSAQATVVARDANNQVIALGTRPLVWSSSNPGVATITSGGVITAVGVGSTQLRASVTEGSNTVVGTAAFSVTAIPNAPLSADVTMPGETFSPSDIIVKLNGTVRFIFPSLEHNVFWSALPVGAPADINTTSNRTVTRTFPTSGVFPFRCTLHAGMVGTVIVSP